MLNLLLVLCIVIAIVGLAVREVFLFYRWLRGVNPVRRENAARAQRLSGPMDPA